MPQIEQIQVVHWGALRPDPVDLATDGINVATGPNGSGKTTFLDAIKLILGVDDLGRRSSEYVFDGGGDPGLRAGRALIKATFANPDRPGRAGRLFSDVGRGCELAEHVSAICEVTREGRRYLVLPGYVPWGGVGRSFEEDLRQLQEVPVRDWMRPKRYAEIMARAGVSKALLGVISLKQGETDRAIEGSPESLLRRVLELTGKQATLDEFRDARAKLIKAKNEHAEAVRALRGEEAELKRLELQVQRHEEYVAKKERLQRLDELELPAARYAELRAQRDRLASERDGLRARVTADRTAMGALEAEIPKLQSSLDQAQALVARLEDEANSAQEVVRRTAQQFGSAGSQLQEAERIIRRASELVDPLDPEAAADAERNAASAERTRDDAEQERTRAARDLDGLRAGRPPRPDGLDEFRVALSDLGINSDLIADHVEIPRGVAAEAALADGVWTLIVPADRFQDALAFAVKRGYRLPIAAEGQGIPSGALVGAKGLVAAGAYLEEVSLPMGVPGVDNAGVVRGRSWGAYRAPKAPLLGAAARERAISQLEEHLVQLDRELPDLRVAAWHARERASILWRAMDARRELEQLEAAVKGARDLQERARQDSERIVRELAEAGPMSGRLEQDLRAKVDRLEALKRDVPPLESRLKTYERDVETLEEQLAKTSLAPAQAALRDLESVERLESQRDLIANEVIDEERFPEEIRNDAIRAYCENQRHTVEDVERLLKGRQEDLDAVTVEVERARERYDAHLRQVIDQLGRRFREVCEQAGMDGVIERVPSQVEGEFGIDIKVAHTQGEPRRSYRSSAHSGGERAKISILLLLAAMGLEGSADLLIMDEHVAHLDSRNIEFVAQVMTALRDRVQFILATPTNAESLRQGWCDHQVTFYPRNPGEPYAPQVKLLTRVPEGRRYATMGQLSLAD
jgi:chromosome segregation ATPase